MHRLRSLGFGIGILLMLITACKTQKNSIENNAFSSYSATWQKVDSLNKIGQYASAQELVEQIKSHAKGEGNWKEEYRAWMNSSMQGQRNGEELPDIINALEMRADSAVFPLKQLLHSIVAQQTWNHYQQNRWMVLDRTNTAGNPADMRTWGQQRYIDACLKHYQRSLTQRDESIALSTASIGDIILPGNMRIRPTLYDVLAHRALEIYTSSESRLAEPAWRYRMESEDDFELFEKFALRKIQHRDSTSLALNAMRLFKDLTRIHIKDDEADALVHLDLIRLKFVRNKSQNPKKDSLYLQALETLQSRVTEHSSYSDVSHAIAEWHVEAASRFNRLEGKAYKWENKKALEICADAIQRFPESIGAKNCAALAYRINQAELQLNLDEAQLPNEAFPVSITYRNTDMLKLRLYALKVAVNAENNVYGDGLKKIMNRPVVREWTQAIEDDGDKNQHSLELILEGLPHGHYALLVSGTEGFKNQKDLLSLATFWVTDLGVASRVNTNGEQEINVISRKTGRAVNGVTIERYKWNNRGIKRGYELQETRLSEDNKATRFLIAQNSYRASHYKLSLEKDVFICDLGAYRTGEEQARTRTHLFLDRAIYRPGQEIHFKGLVSEGKPNKQKISANSNHRVELLDVNWQQVAELNVTTDAFGAFSGSFTAPSGLTGQMQIKTQTGQQYFRVEEYKRPKFEVKMDPIEGQQRLDQMVVATGKAISYAGVAIDGGTVQWKVFRQARRPWWCWGWFSWGLPWGQDTEIANGSSSTDASGAFRVEFKATPDPAFPKGADPFFDYRIEASVTDINGETQSGKRSLSLAYKSIRIELDIPEVQWADELEAFDIDVLNMNDQHVDAELEINIDKLQALNKPIIPKSWARPDRFVLDEKEFKNALPLRTYDQENEALSWPIEESKFKNENWPCTGNPLALPKARKWAPGTYLLSIKTKDDQGQEVIVRKTFTLLEKKNGKPAMPALFRTDDIKTSVEPGEQASILISSSLPEANVLIELERQGEIVKREWVKLNNEQRILSFDCSEADRGGFHVHLTNFAEGQNNSRSISINVPWSNKDLQFEWMSFRDKLLPGTEEEWRLKITGNKGNKVSAQLLALMYDASLDQFVPHNIGLKLWSQERARQSISGIKPFSLAYGQQLRRNQDWPGGASYTVPLLYTFGFDQFGYRYDGMVMELASAAGGRPRRRRSIKGNVEVMADLAEPMMVDENEGRADDAVQISGVPANLGANLPPSPPPVIRSDFRETAFFFPDLLTDRQGNTVLRFKTPEALTRWKVLGLAHTKELAIGQFSKETVTQKPLMVTPNLPRFFRELDRITITSKISAIEDRIEGTVSLELFDPFSNKPVDKAFGHKGTQATFVCAPGESAVVEWPLSIPDSYDAVGVRIVARSGGGPQNTIRAADGEEHVLPILSDRILVTESLPLAVRKPGTHNFTFDKLTNNTSSTLKHKALTLEYTANPAWYAVQALPYMMEFPHECAEQTFSRYYANALASHITTKKPAIRKVFDQWKADDSEALLSNLEKNQELKNILIEETPWLMDARNESEQKERLAILFDMKRMAREEEKAMAMLREMQSAEGGWPWFSGMRPSRGVTQHILSGMGHLEKLGVSKVNNKPENTRMLEQAVRWLDKEVAKDFREMKRWNKKWKEMRPGYWDIQYLYARSFFSQWGMSEGARAAADFYKERLSQEWLSYGLQEQGLIAMILHRDKHEEVPALILKSLKERATMHEELGMFWKGFRAGFAWNTFPTETHATLIECFNEVGKDTETVKELRVYLLKLKQTTNWKTTKATAQACYALLLGGSDWLKPMPLPTIQLGEHTLKEGMKELQAEAGTGYIKRSWQGEELKPGMGNISVSSNNDRVSWGAVHWQYLEQMDKVTPHEDTPFTIKKDIMLKKASDEGDVLIKVEEVQNIKPGDVITIRIELRTDRHLDYVHMKDLRGAGLEPIERLSGYKYQGGLGYYQSIKDAAMHFFFDRIAPGTYVFEYDLRVTHEGDFSNGITTAMCMYAPEFNGHSSGERVKVARD